jgi:RNA polymerase sigma-70 factor (ECF subfamily)
MRRAGYPPVGGTPGDSAEALDLGDDVLLDHDVHPLGLEVGRDRQVDAVEMQEALESALQALPDDDRSLLLMRSIDDASHETLAEAFSTTVPAVKSRLHRTRLLLRSLLDERLRGKPPP